MIVGQDDGSFTFFYYLCSDMKKMLLLTLAGCLLVACQPSEDEKAVPLMQRIDSLYQAGDYQGTLNAIRVLRADHPGAVESRKRALHIWQEASLKMAQNDIARTDSALQATTAAWEHETQLARKNQLKAKLDSLQIRYDALCGTVRVIHRRQAE